ncbi:MAG: efflux RND transporter permease subunit, partial [Rikenellaceae bacterium]
MKNLISLFVKYPFYAKMFIIATAALGILSFMRMNKSYFPITESKSISISVSYQGATPKEMEEGVVTLIENSL